MTPYLVALVLLALIAAGMFWPEDSPFVTSYLALVLVVEVLLVIAVFKGRL